MVKTLLIALSCVIVLPASEGREQKDIDSTRFVDVAAVVQGLLLDIRYATTNNFVGESIDGYNSGKCILTTEAAQALKMAQNLAQAQGLRLLIYDCYRPQQAVDHFMRWAGNDNSDIQAAYYPNLDKQQLLEEVYIARKSGHSRGSTLDLSLIRADSKLLTGSLKSCAKNLDQRNDGSLDMGTGYDCFDPRSNTDHPHTNEDVLVNRHLLRGIMEEAGFRNYPKEWWHYTLNDEPYPDSYFNFPVE